MASRDLLNRLVLPDHPLMQDLVQMQQLLALALHQTWKRGCPVQRATILAISSSVTLSRSRLFGCSLPRPCFSSSSSSLLAAAGSLPYLQLGGLVQVVFPLGAASISALTCSISSRSFCTLPMDASSRFPSWAFIAVELLAHLGQLLLHVLQMLSGEVVCLLFQSRLLDLHAG